MRDNSSRVIASGYASHVGVPGVLFWLAPSQRIHTRSPSREAGASAVLGQHNGYFWLKADIPSARERSQIQFVARINILNSRHSREAQV